MILVFTIANGRTRIITGVTNFYAFGDTFVFNREGQKQPVNVPNNYNFGLALDISFLLKRYSAIYAICGLDDCNKFGVGNGLIKWIAWGGEFIAGMTEDEAHKFLKENPL